MTIGARLQHVIDGGPWPSIHCNGRVGSLIGGDIVPGDGAAIEVLDASTGQPLFRYLDGSDELVRRAAESAAAAQVRWAAMPADGRAAVLLAVSAAIRANLARLAELEAVTAARPIRDCRAQVDRVADMFQYYAGWCDKFYGDVIPVPNQYLNYTVREPIGVLLHIVPWNSPLFMAAWHLAPSLATGNAVLLKPSELTPLSAIALVRIAESAGLPTGLVAVLAGLGHTMGNAAIEHPLVRKIGFVGSPETGAKVAGAAARVVKPCVLELGGKSANIVFPDADLDQLCEATVKGMFIGAGQTCVAPSRLIVHRSLEQQVVERLLDAASTLEMGLPELDSTAIGPIHNRRQFDHVNRMIEQGRRDGARCRQAGNAVPQRGLYVPPTIFTGVARDGALARQEVFGPVMACLPFDTEQEAIDLANDTEFGLAGAVWTHDVKRAHRVAAAINAGTVWINTYKSTDIRSPFGGIGLSGYGRSSGREALQEYTRLKSIWVAT
ncbi:aldehyde dehydrogenase family protein [Bordetella bronchiseptica]|uniref:aldehyde dehydrogenase family protein n=1 Tax=Bordetella bronchiseptica TaxID=518 RepID=UPI00028FAE91|nr:aldehyde dehydrogenase family protein [Bordetella bronchiseptica]AWQ03803.1 aldehyde dehydrogenase [Bordetella bronchiseptica]KAK71333.1 putative aldehyde dehydrogenase DhaS [Bordetella bronchiseptica MO211]CCN16965.1 aldehyde dehydrogenase [Bordetella bronchiseptica MO211]